MAVAGLIAELQRRRVIRALIGYGVAAFAILQIIEPVMHGLHWPEATLSYTVVALALGFPVVVALAWIFDVKDGRIERDPRGVSGARLALLAAGLGAIAAAPGVVWYFVVRGPQREAPAAGPPSIAVLPFANLSREADNEYFSDGLTEELINALANVDGLRVASRTAVFALKGQPLGVDQLGARLGVAMLLEGSVRREGQALRVTAQLINVADGYHLWSKSYDRELRSVFAVEDEIARSVAQALRRTLVREGGVKPATTDTEAHDLYLKGRFFWNKRTVEAFGRAQAEFEKAIAKDPSYALAWAGLADTIAIRLDYDTVRGVDLLPQAREKARRALEIDPRLAEGHAALGNIAWHDFDWATGESELRRAIELRPDYATAHQWLAELLAETGRFDEARAEIGRAIAADPTALIVNACAGNIELWAGRFDAALEKYARTLDLDPTFEMARMMTVTTLIEKGDARGAAGALAQLRASTDVLVLVFRAWSAAATGEREEALRILRELDRRREYVSPGELAQVWLALGEADRAMGLLERGCAERDASLISVGVEPVFAPARRHPRWPMLAKCMNLPEALTNAR